MTASAPPPVLEARDLHTYYGGAHILADLSFVLNDGEVVVLLGRNGAGKTTTMKSVMGLVRMRAGTVHLEGADITGEEPHVIARAGMGYVPEARTLMGNPKVLLLDEPSEGLAPVIVDQMAATIQALKAEGLSILLSEQNLHFATAVSDRAYIVEKGRIRYEGTMDALAADAEVRNTYLTV